MSAIHTVLDIMEGYDTEAGALKARIDKVLSKGDRRGLELGIGECFDKAAPEAIVEIRVEETSIVGGYGEIFFDVMDLLQDGKFSIWSRFVVENMPCPGPDSPG